MRLKVRFREYTKPYVDPETGEEHRGDYIQAFSREVEGNTIVDVLDNADTIAEELSEKYESDIRVWETSVVITPRGIRQ